MNNLNQIIPQYLATQTNYALLITGNWGVGKTYYYKNTLEKVIVETETIEDASKKYRSIYISLFGLQTIEEIQRQIFLSLYPILKNKYTKLSFSLFKPLARGIMTLKNWGNPDDYFSEIKPDKGDWINLNQLVICLDDLERKSENLPLEELIGFINSLVENNDAKIILIANEDKIDEDKYNDLKEKVIGVTVEFLPDFEKRLKSIIDSRYLDGFKTYAEFLEKNISRLLEFEKAIDGNLRILIFALDHLHTIYAQIRNEVLDQPRGAKSIIKDKLDLILHFSMAISIEYRKGNISFSRREGIDISGISNLISSATLFDKNDGKEEVEPDYRTIFLEKYYSRTAEYHFFDSIYSFITGGGPFIVDRIQLEVNKAFHVVGNEILPHYLLLQKLSYRNYLSLGEKEYRKLTREMVELAARGNYCLGDYPTIFHFATRFENLLNFKIESLVKRLKKGLKIAKTHDTYKPSMDIYLTIPTDAMFREDLIELKNYALELNEELHVLQERESAKEMLAKMSSDFETFREILFSADERWSFTPLFHVASPQKIYREINQSPLDRLYGFFQIFNDRYKGSVLLYLREEIDFLKKLELKLRPTSKQRNKKSLKNYWLNLIHKQISIGIDNLKKV